ncbi:MAG: hypothetical protein QXU45_08285 [Candidatus Bathyarchaeia archaeon]
MSLEEYAKEKLWPILVETVHAMVMYPHHKAYTRDVLLHENPDITPSELASRLGIPLGEALVILYELKNEKGGVSP